MGQKNMHPGARELGRNWSYWWVVGCCSGKCGWSAAAKTEECDAGFEFREEESGGCFGRHCVEIEDGLDGDALPLSVVVVIHNDYLLGFMWESTQLKRLVNSDDS